MFKLLASTQPCCSNYQLASGNGVQTTQLASEHGVEITILAQPQYFPPPTKKTECSAPPQPGVRWAQSNVHQRLIQMGKGCWGGLVELYFLNESRHDQLYFLYTFIIIIIMQGGPITVCYFDHYSTFYFFLSRHSVHQQKKNSS